MCVKVRSVGIAEMLVSDDPDDVLVAYGLGSCVAVCVYDPIARVGGMLHALLPTSLSNNGASGNPYKFVDCGIPLLIEAVVGSGGKTYRMIAALWGGAKVLSAPGFDKSFDIGLRNVQEADEALKAKRLRVVVRDIGGQSGRTVKFQLGSGEAIVRSVGGKSTTFNLVG